MVTELTVLAWGQIAIMALCCAGIASDMKQVRLIGAWGIGSLVLVVQWRPYGGLTNALFPWWQ